MRKGKGLKLTLAAALVAAELVGCQSPSAPQQAAPLKPETTEQAPPAKNPTVATADTNTGTGETTTVIKPQPTSAPSADVAKVGNVTISRDELEKPLMEAYGFNLLMVIIQRDMARQACREQGITVTQADIDKEWTTTLDELAKDNPDADKQKLLDQYLSQPKTPGQTSTRAEWGIIMESNAYLRKLAEPKVKTTVTDEALHQAFDEQYAAQVRVRHIAVSNVREAMQLKQMLADGGDFNDLARKYSRAETAKMGGELPPFSINSSRFPDVFKRTAFALKIGQVSDPVQAEGSYHLIQLEERIANKVVKFDDVKDSLREDLQAQVMAEAMKAIRARLAQDALAQMKITDPILKAEYDRRLAIREGQIKGRDKIRQEMDKERAEQPTTVPTSGPATAPAAPASQPVTTPVAPVVPPKPPVTAPAAKPVVAPAPIPTPTPAPRPQPAPAPATRPAATQAAPVAPAAPAHAMPAAPTTAPAAAPATKP